MHTQTKLFPYYQLEIAPLTALSLKRSPLFTYVSATAVPIGSLVSIPFGTQTLRGIVCTTTPLARKPAAWIKAIHSVIAPEYVTDHQRAIAYIVSDLYWTSLGKTLVHFAPLPTKSIRLLPTPPNSTSNTKTPTAIHAKRLPSLLVPGRYILTLHPKEYAETLALFIDAQHKRARKNHSPQSILILVPEIIMAELLSAHLYHRNIPHFLLTSHQKKSLSQQAWEQARIPGSIIIGTRQALFAPFTDLSTIFMIDPIDNAYKQWDMSPRYDARRVAQHVATHYNASLVTFSSCMRIADLKECHDTTATHTDLIDTESLAPVEITNLRLERYHKNYSPLSTRVREHITRAISRNETIALIVHQSGYSKLTICKHCKHIFRCPECQASLHPEKSGAYTCSVCAHQTPLFPNCDHCGQLGFEHIGFGSERVEREVKKLFPSARIQRIDKNILKTAASRAHCIDTITSRAVDLFIGVPSVLNLLDTSELTTVVFVDADTFLQQNDFQTDEHFIERVLRAKLLAGKHGTVFLETFQPESTFMQRLTTTDQTELLQDIYMDRKALGYPPFTNVTAIEIIRDSRDKANTVAHALEKSLQTLPESEKWRIFIQQAPDRPFRSRYTARIIIRLSDPTFPPSLRHWFNTLPKDTFIDRDPLSLHV